MGPSCPQFDHQGLVLLRVYLPNSVLLTVKKRDFLFPDAFMTDHK